MTRWLPLLLCGLGFAQSPEGHFLGELSTPAGKLRLALSVRFENSEAKGEMLSLDQGYAKLPVEGLKIEEKQLSLVIPRAMASFRGEFSEDFTKLVGKFVQGTEYELILERVTEIPQPKRPQTPQAPFPYDRAEVRFKSQQEGVLLSGTLTIPQGEGPFPTVILLSGSGPQDRDETLALHKPFWVLADYLSRQGFAVLRYDDRGTAGSTGTFKGSTSLDFAEDAKGAISFLRGQQKINPQQIVLIGHSEGGIIAPMIAALDENLAALVLLAAPGVPGEQILIRQTVDLARAAGMPEDQAKAAGAMGMAQLTAMKERDAWMRFFWSYDPAAALEKTKCPVLALNGSLDMQVNADINLAAIEAALKKSENKNFAIKRLDGLNHLFQTAQTGAGLEYGRIEETFAPSAMEEISSWLKKTLETQPKAKVE